MSVEESLDWQSPPWVWMTSSCGLLSWTEWKGGTDMNPPFSHCECSVISGLTFLLPRWAVSPLNVSFSSGVWSQSWEQLTMPVRGNPGTQQGLKVQAVQEPAATSWDFVFSVTGGVHRFFFFLFLSHWLFVSLHVVVTFYVYSFYLLLIPLQPEDSGFQTLLHTWEECTILLAWADGLWVLVRVVNGVLCKPSSSVLICFPLVLLKVGIEASKHCDSIIHSSFNSV